MFRQILSDLLRQDAMCQIYQQEKQLSCAGLSANLGRFMLWTVNSHDGQHADSLLCPTTQVSMLETRGNCWI